MNVRFNVLASTAEEAFGYIRMGNLITDNLYRPGRAKNRANPALDNAKIMITAKRRQLLSATIQGQL